MISSQSHVSRLISHVFSVLWRLVVIALPWQTRWMFNRGTIAGFQWEAATISFYGTWAAIILLAMISTVLYWDRWKEAGNRVAGVTTPRHGLFAWIAHLKESFKKPSFKERMLHALNSSMTRLIITIFIACSLFLPTLYSANPEVSLYWWAGIVMLALLFSSLWIASLDRMTVIFWFVLSLVPHAALGIYQYLYQDAFGFSWLGMATHHPWIHGTSVVEHGLYRVLRAYGGLPHPNILGGWLAIGLTALPFLIAKHRHSLWRIFIQLTGFLFSCALVFSYSRSAWIAAIVGLISVAYWLWKSFDDVDRLRLVSFLIVILASVGVCVGINWDHVNARFHPDENQLEAWSIGSRVRASHEGLEAFRFREVSGWGQGESLVASIVARTPELKRYPILILVDPEPAHNIPQVILVETGLLGLLGILVLCLMMYRFVSRPIEISVLKKWRIRIWIPHPCICVLVVLAAADHYLWTLWAGQSLVMMSLLMALHNPAPIPLVDSRAERAH